jgi:hypothetical protein
MQLLRRWENEAETAGRMIKRIAVAYETGRDGFWLARWRLARRIEACVVESDLPKKVDLNVKQFTLKRVKHGKFLEPECPG